MFAGKVDTYYNVDTNGKHPPPPILCTVHDTFWLLSPRDGGSCLYDITHSFDQVINQENREDTIRGSTFIEQTDSYASEYRGYWVHPKLVNYISIWALPKYATIVGEIMDKINETTIAEHEADKTQAIADQFHSVINTVTDILSDRITKLNQQVRQLAPRAVPNGKERTYILIVEEVNEDEQLEEQLEDQITI
ncbi:MAG: hypothetical protein EZS28_005860 [Streblomastix strix]|uniref:KilA/APSES-type HTH DNA-binding domain-containing protein n=1 Tax=Streblomastix strix TaxID=222440 RepID=A0A5J4WW92_9EUKA|nr:MAG: hypothetical protein EZS28_005860 [Streblomastix strix]